MTDAAEAKPTDASRARRHLPVIADEAGATRAPTRDQLRSRRPRDVRSKTLSRKRCSQREIELGRHLYPEQPGVDYQRPRTRAECVNGLRPCPYVSCQHHLYLDVSLGHGSLRLNFPDIEPADMAESCALDVADRGGATLEEVGAVMNLTREAVRLIETAFKAKLRPYLAQAAVDFGLDPNGAGTTDDTPAVPADIASICASILRAHPEVDPNALSAAAMATLQPRWLDALRARYVDTEAGRLTPMDAVAERLGVTEATARSHVSQAFRRLGVKRKHPKTRAAEEELAQALASKQEAA